MRLRSSQFVFLLLLVCSVQLAQEHALQLGASAVSDSTAGSSHRPPSAVHVPLPLGIGAMTQDLPGAMQLDAASRAANQAPWPMPRPALDAAAVSSFTGLYRA